MFNLVDSFPVEDIIKPVNFKSLFFYCGLLSMVGKEYDEPVFGVPNACVERQMRRSSATSSTSSRGPKMVICELVAEKRY